MSIRPVKRLTKSQLAMEGAGVRLRRAFGFGDTTEVDPFLLFDDFRGDRPDDYLAGFPWHPHRGIETITYVLAGNVDHGDSLGNSGTIGAGDVQWMTAGSGIIHQEMPRGDASGRMGGFQLWANLPAAHCPQRPAVGLGQHRQHPVLEVREVGVTAQLGVERRRQQLGQGCEAHPGRALPCVQPPRLFRPPTHGAIVAIT